MATVPKRKLPSGLTRWQASYVDGPGKRRSKLFDRKSDGETWIADIQHDVRRGLHTPGSISPIIKEAATQLAALNAENAELKSALDNVVNADNSLAKQLSETIAANAVLDARVKELKGHLTDTEVTRRKELQVLMRLKNELQARAITAALAVDGLCLAPKSQRVRC